MAEKVAGELYYDLDGQLLEVKRQLRQPNGYPFNPELLKVHLQAAIEGRFQNQPPVGRYFMTVTLGTEKSTKALGEAVEASGKKISDWARQILKKTPVSPEQIELDIYEVSGAELGFTNAVPRQEIYNRAFGYGFQVSPAEVGPKSRIKCNDKKWRIVGMDPIADAGGYPGLFDLYGDSDGFWLRTFYGDPGHLWYPDFVWLFVWPRRKSLLFLPLYFIWRSFVLSINFHSSHPASDRSRSLFLKAGYIYCYPKTLFPKESSEKFLRYRFYEWLISHTAIFLPATKNWQW